MTDFRPADYKELVNFKVSGLLSSIIKNLLELIRLYSISFTIALSGAEDLKRFARSRTSERDSPNHASFSAARAHEFPLRAGGIILPRCLTNFQSRHATTRYLWAQGNAKPKFDVVSRNVTREDRART